MSCDPTRHTVVPDRVVAATYLAAVGMAGGEVTIADARPDHMEMLLRKVGQMGVATEMGPHGLRASASRAAGGGRRRHPARTRAWPPTTARCWWPCSRWPTGWGS